MSETTTINVELRKDVGKGASRRLRREGKVPAVIYGGRKDPVALSLQLNDLLQRMKRFTPVFLRSRSMTKPPSRRWCVICIGIPTSRS